MPHDRIRVTPVYSIDELTGAQRDAALWLIVGEMERRGVLSGDYSIFDLTDNHSEYLADWATAAGLDFLEDGTIYNDRMAGD